jgi:hypothetical protein
MIRTPRWLAVIGGVFVAGGAATIGAAVGAGVHAPPAPPVSTTAYASTGACSGCPAGTRLDSVEVQSRQGSTLFVLRGQWPRSIDAFGVDVCLDVGDTRIALKPHGSEGVFDTTVSTTSQAVTTPPLAEAIATSLQGDALLVDLQPSLQPSVPILFDVALCSSTGMTLQRLPSSGELRWRGSGAPMPVAMTVQSSPSSPDPAALPGACNGVPSGSVPAFLQMTGSSAAVQTDPRTRIATQEVTTTLAASPVPLSAPFSIAALVLPEGTASVLGATRVIDRVGTEQLYAFYDGQHLHKALRTFANGVWTTLIDSAASAMTIALEQGSASFFWSGIHPGDHVGFITAGSAGCGAFGLNAVFVPQLTVTG